MEATEARRSFDAVADLYHEIRPSYPAALFDDLFALLPDAPHIVEVGPGTGLATTDLINRGASVHGIELGANMAAKLRDVVTSDRLRVTVGDFETVDVENRCADSVFCATAFHWISPPAQLDRPAEILRIGGVVAIVDTIQVEDDNAFFAAAQPVYERHGEGHRGPPAPKRNAVDPPMRERFAGDARYADLRVRTYDWDQRYTAGEYVKLMCSYSNTQLMPHDRRQALLDDIERLIVTEFEGEVVRPLVVTLTTTTLRGT